MLFFDVHINIEEFELYRHLFECFMVRFMFTLSGLH